VLVSCYINSFTGEIIMDIKVAGLYQEMQTFARQARNVSGDVQIGPPQVDNTSQSDFSQLLKQALNTVNGLQKNNNELQTAVEMGDPQVSLAQAMIAGQKASIAFDATVQIRNRLVEAYKEVMAMPV
jgi:flagellar hook-basal body complex protein FliE